MLSLWRDSIMRADGLGHFTVAKCGLAAAAVVGRARFLVRNLSGRLSRGLAFPTPRARYLLLGGVAALLGLSGACPAYAQSSQEMSHTPRRFFLSGHSLTDNPYGNYIKAISESQGAPLSWNQQIVIGSPIRVRTKGGRDIQGEWEGYAGGKDRDGRPGVNVLAEFASRTEPLYDTLLIMDAHHTAAQLIWNDTVRYLRHFHERLIERNKAGRTYILEPWETLKDLGDPGPWLENERNATVVWSCVATRINASLAHEGRSDRLTTIPTAPAMAALVDAIASNRAPAALTSGGTRAAIERLLPDGVHLSSRGHYYAAMLAYMQMTGKETKNAWYPSNALPQSEALALQEFAWKFLEDRRRNFALLDLPACRRFIATTYCGPWNAYVPGKWVNRQGNCADFFSRETVTPNNRNPFVFDAQSDGAYWFASP